MWDIKSNKASIEIPGPAKDDSIHETSVDEDETLESVVDEEQEEQK
jgi:hypothetical protein